jgi:GTP cyclohydrolase I
MSTVDLPDVQRSSPTHRLPINRVGIKGLRYPVRTEVDGEPESTVATLSLSVLLDPEERGTHMSRFVESVESLGVVSATSLPAIVRDLAQRLNTREATFEASFPFFLRRAAPESGASALVDYEGALRAVLSNDGEVAVKVIVRVPVTSLCPCSKEISDYGAHSQRGYVAIEASPASADLDVAELVSVAEAAASAPIYSLLKRDDERRVTMGAYDNPAFVEDLARSVAASLTAHPKIASFSVEIENQESIHNHSAWARIS